MRILVTVFIVLGLSYLGYSDEEGSGLLLDDILPYISEESSEEQEQQLEKEAEPKQEEAEEKEESTEVEQKKEQQAETSQPEKIEQEPKREIKPEVKPQPEEVKETEKIVPKGLGTITERFLIQEIALPEQEEQIPESDRLTTVVEIQKALALQNARNQLAELEQKLLKINLEKEKLKKEIRDLKNPIEKTQMTDKPVYIHGGSRIPGGSQELDTFRVMMISSVDGMRALIRDGVNVYHVHKGDYVSKGIVKDITRQGILVEQEEGEVLYPVMH